MNRRHIAILCFSTALVGGPALGQDLSAYRGVYLADGLKGVVAATGASPADIKLVHERPVLMQELEWRPQSLGGSILRDDPVQRVLFSFYLDHLYRILVTYDRTRIDGLTDADLIDALNPAFGTPLTPLAGAAANALSPFETPDLAERYRVVARWENAEHSIVLVRGDYLVPLSLVMLAKHVATDARHADLEGTRLNLSERPAREALKAREAADAQRLAQEKVRPANKAAFKP